MEVVLQKKILLSEILSAETDFILQHVQQNKLITDRDYRALRSLPQNTDRAAFELLDKLRDKGEDTCQTFLGLLRQPCLLEQYPRLREIFTDLTQGVNMHSCRAGDCAFMQGSVGMFPGIVDQGQLPRAPNVMGGIVYFCLGFF